jgi:Cupin superfamily protein
VFNVPTGDDDHDGDGDDNSNSTGPVEQVILRPGDVLYFPAGMWHKVEVLEPGISINISLMATNYATLTCQALQHLLLQRKGDDWRECIVAPRGQKQEQQTTSSSVVDHLNKLLQELPTIIQEFQRSGGAQAILPPVLHHGKQFVAPDDLDDENEDNCSNERNKTTSSTKEEKHCDEQDRQSDRDNHVSHDNDEADYSNNDDEDDDDDANDLVDLRTEPPRTANILAFDPSRSALRKRLGKYRLVKNPLASLIPQWEITRFYSGDVGSKHDVITKDSDDNQPPFVYVLNVNYAGNEGHESCVRVRIQSHDHANLHLAFCDEVNVERMSQQLLLHEDQDDDGEEGNPCHTIAWLLYLGYLVWVERN